MNVSIPGSNGQVLGIGIDQIEIDRIRENLDSYGNRFRRRVFTEAEQAFCRNRANPAASFAARFAAKEAVSKAFGTGISGGIRWTDIEVIRKDGEPPEVRLCGDAAAIADRRGVSNVLISLTHNRTRATAVALLSASAD